MRAIAEGLFTDEPAPRLIGGRAAGSDRIVFPCPQGGGFEPVPLAREGRLWSWTVQRFRPKSPPYAGPDSFRPWIVAYVELPDEVIVEARLTGVEPDAIAIGMPLVTATAPLDPDDPDSPVIPAFRPAGGTA